MRTKILLLLFAFANVSANAQLVSCRPRICMFYYWGHNDNVTNPAMTTIKSTKPDFLIDNTAGGLWGGGCIPAQYSPLGIKVFSYITGGYEGHKYGGDTSLLSKNIMRINNIKNDGAYGVFLDNVSNYPDSTRMAYISTIYNTCKAQGLFLILNPGTPYFDTALMSHCDFLMSDEQYGGIRAIQQSESPFLNRIIVANQNVTNATTASNISLAARSQGFGYSYACTLYTSFPTWISSYFSLVTNIKPATPIVTVNGSTINSSSTYGNQWYEKSVGLLAGKKDQMLIPAQNGYFYTIVTLDGCPSDTSNVVHITTTGFANMGNNRKIQVYPNPTTDFIEVTDIEINSVLKLIDLNGRLVMSLNLLKSNEQIYVGNLPKGVYLATIATKGSNHHEKLVVQ